MESERLMIGSTTGRIESRHRHSERWAAEDASQQRLFDALVAAARERRRGRR